MKKRTLLGLMAGLPVSGVLTACGGDNSGSAQVRLVNASPGYSALDLYIDDNLKVSNVAYGAASGYVSVDSGSFDTALSVNGSSTQLITTSRTYETDTTYSIVAYGWNGSLKSVIVTESQDDASDGSMYFRVLNTATDAGSVDVYLTAEDDDLGSATAVASSVGGGKSTSFGTVDAGTYRLRVTVEGETDDSSVLLDVSNVTVSSKGVYTLIVTPTIGGVLVNALLMKQKGDVTALNTTMARVRLVCAMPGGARVAAAVGDTTLTSGNASPAVIGYTLVDVSAGTLTIQATVDGVATPSTTWAATAGSDVTVLVSGATATDATPVVITDDNRLSTSSTKYKMRLMHASQALSSDALTLTVDLTDIVSNQAYRAASSYVNRAANSSSVVTVSSLNAGQIFSLSEQSLVAQGVYDVIVLDKLAAGTDGILQTYYFSNVRA